MTETTQHPAEEEPMTDEEALATVSTAVEEMRLSRLALDKHEAPLIPRWMLSVGVALVLLVTVAAIGINAYRTLFPAVPTYTLCVQVDQAGHVLPGKCNSVRAD